MMSETHRRPVGAEPIVGTAADRPSTFAAATGGAAAGPANASMPAAAAPARTQKLVLIVDDDREMVEGLKLVLERQGYRVMHATDGHQGKQMIYTHRPDLVILDMMMPRMGGFPVLEHFRDKPNAPPIIMITANEGSRHKAYAEYLGVVDYIRKPFAMERLLESVNKVLRPSQDPPAAGQ